jgi:hypothetical protein
MNTVSKGVARPTASPMGEASARVIAIGGIAGPLLWATSVAVNGALAPGYSHARQYISELAAQGSPTQRLMQVTGFILPGALIAAFGASVAMRTRRRLVEIGGALIAVSGLCRIVAGVMTCDAGCGRMGAGASSSQHVHDLAGVTALLIAVTACVVWVIIDARGPRRSLWYSAWSVVTIALAIGAGSLLRRTGIAEVGDVGTIQRLSLGALNLWVLGLAVRQIASNHCRKTEA